MSIVGPRPERTVFVDQFKDEVPDYMKKHMVKAGITGLTPLLVALELKGMLVASLVALLCSGFGALYPALRAANQDAVKALAYE